MKNIRIELLTMTLSVFALFSGYAQQVSFLDVGEKVDTYPIVTWIKGEPIPNFENDKIYVIELWATWCKPCVASMPHISALNTKFKDKIIFIGQNVWEEDLTKVTNFLVKNEGIMNYRIAYAGGPKGASDFDKKWIKPSGTIGIPRTFIIQNKQLVYMTEPSKLNEDMLQLLVDGKFSVEAADKLSNK